MTPTMEEVAGWLREASIPIVLLGKNFEERRKFKNLFLDRASQVEAMGWRPISEAPKNERVYCGPKVGMRQILASGQKLASHLMGIASGHTSQRITARMSNPR